MASQVIPGLESQAQSSQAGPNEIHYAPLWNPNRWRKVAVPTTTPKPQKVYRKPRPYNALSLTFNETWDSSYVPSYPGRLAGEVTYTGIDYDLLYDGIDNIIVPCAGQTTGLEAADFIPNIPDLDPEVFTDQNMIDFFVNSCNKYIHSVLDLGEDMRYPMPGTGKSRKFYFLSYYVVGGLTCNGFLPNEKPLRPISFNAASATNVDIMEYTGITCAGRYYPVSRPSTGASHKNTTFLTTLRCSELPTSGTRTLTASGRTSTS